MKFKNIIGYYRNCDLLTMTGTISAFIGMIFVLNYHYTLSILFLLISGLCDAFDGKLARKRNNSDYQRAYGVELDSLSDIVCFGVFPALLTAALCYSIIGYIICIFYLLCGLVRLAYFNMLNITKQAKKNIYIGLPITTVAVVYPIVLIIVRMINFKLLRIVMPLVLLLLGIGFIARFEVPKIDISKVLKKVFNKYVINYLFFPLYIIIASDLYYKLNFSAFNFSDLIETIKYNILPFICLLIFFSSITILLNCIFKKSKTSKLILLIIIAIFLTICDIKYTIMSNPIELSDVYYLNADNVQMMNTATGTIGNWIFLVLVKTFAFLIVGLSFIFFDKFFKIEFNKKSTRLKVSLIAIVLIVFPFLSLFKFNSFYLKHIYGIKRVEKINNINNDKLYYKYGLYQGIYLNELSKKMVIPTGYTITKANNAIQESLENTKKSIWPKSNVVFILSEAFSDIQNIDEIEFDKRLTPNIDKYQKEGKIVADLLVPSYGGVTVNTEFEVLTGATIHFMKSGFIPWTQYYNTFHGKTAPNLIKEFNNNDYETIYMTPWGRYSYRSEYVYNLFGISKTIYGDELKGKNKGEYYSDQSFVNDIYNLLKKDDGKYKFIMSSTGQNHFPYNRSYDKYDISVKKTKYNKEDTKLLKTYAQGIYDADKSLGYLYDKIQKLKTPTIIVFYGDHLPYTVNSNGKNPYLKSSYFHTKDLNINYLRKYTTKAVIVANYDLKVNDIKYIKSSYLGAYVINKMDLDISDYYKFIDYTRTIIPVFNWETMQIGNKAMSIDDIPEKEKLQLTKYRYVQYNRLYDSDN